ncbi:MAG: hypothetical protein HP491_05315 [Nitrospira sp.]|nr:hypothetical protein [Nitrospira sp.]MBH0182021.1 hypothetical protein [Nitrospira sp.]MBH0185296.1 hypothetical protein [Nitrospira sp.]MBH0197181.1 hypothetical protein [Nitrospira sp.]
MYQALILSMLGVLLQGCASTLSQNVLQPTALKLIGKTQADLLQCAGQPITKSSYGQAVVLRYYKEASMFEESRPFLKGSQPGIHHGCWARLLIENDRVVGIEFQMVPEAAGEPGDECEEIFQACSP